MKAYWLGSARVYDADEVDAEIARLREAINEWHRETCLATGRDPLRQPDLFLPSAVALAQEIAREGR